jgi:GNAT superfamily N-acetyltransferase
MNTNPVLWLQAIAGGRRMRETLPNGAVVRKLWIGEIDKYREHLMRLDPKSRRSRFGGSVSDEFICKYVNAPFMPNTVVYGCFIDRTLRGATELRPFGHNYQHEAEVAISVKKPWQSHGVGSALLRRILLAARNRGYRHLHMECLAENTRMQQLARRFDAELSFDFGTLTGEIMSSHSNPVSLIRELISDCDGLVMALLELPSQILRPQ